MNQKLLLMIGVPIAVLLIFWLLKALGGRNSSGETDHMAEAEVYLRYGDRDKAIRALEEGLKNKPDDPILQKKLEEVKRA